MGGFYAKFIPRFADIVTPLNELKKKGARFEWERVPRATYCCCEARSIL